MRKTASPPKKGALAQQTPANAIVIQNAYSQGGQ